VPCGTSRPGEDPTCRPAEASMSCAGARALAVPNIRPLAHRFRIVSGEARSDEPHRLRTSSAHLPGQRNGPMDQSCGDRRRHGDSHRVLQIVLQDLQRSKLVTSRSGPKGGYALGRRPEMTTVCEVVESLEGPLGSGECALRGGPCHWDEVCALHKVWSSAPSPAGALAVGDPRRSGSRGQSLGEP